MKKAVKLVLIILNFVMLLFCGCLPDLQPAFQSGFLHYITSSLFYQALITFAILLSFGLSGLAVVGAIHIYIDYLFSKEEKENGF